MPARAPTRRLPAAERRAQIVAAASELFAREGFGGSTRALAAALGLTQAALYKHFASKEALIDAVFEAEFGAARRKTDPRAALARSDASLEDRLVAFYDAYFAGGRPERLRLWLRANLDGLGFATRYTPALDRLVVFPILAALRAEAGARGRPAKADREIVMQLHASLVFARIRRHVYATPIGDAELAALTRRYVAIWLPGALAACTRT
ncbi:MAG: TetR/AcrR family transcriptional regulator [Tagaea sp.]|nr:TetR/AcrR family transcriptional regulator [Tagaea sp.]